MAIIYWSWVSYSYRVQTSVGMVSCRGTQAGLVLTSTNACVDDAQTPLVN